MNPLLLMLASVNLAQWATLERADQLVLKKPMKLAHNLTIKAGTTFTIQELTPLHEIQVESFDVTFAPCSPLMDQREAPMVILDGKFGAELNAHCTMTFYVEFKDLYQESFFEKKNP